MNTRPELLWHTPGTARPAPRAPSSPRVLPPNRMSAAMKTMLALFAVLLLALPLHSSAQTDPRSTSGLGTVYVFRSRADDGGTYYLTYQTRTLARLKAGNYVVLRLPAGRQYLLADPSAEQIYGFNVVAGANQYIEVITEGNLLRRRPSLVNSNEQEFESLRSRLKEIPVRDDPGQGG